MILRGPFVAWALGIAKNVIKAHFRKQQKRLPNLEGETAVDRVAEAFEEISPHLEDMKEALAACIERVPANSRQILAKQYEDGLKPAEIAAEVGKSANHVAVMLHRLRGSLRECVERRMKTMATAF